ncbi:MAG: hypothetical protein AB8F94_04875 [Saprospiraceae bacterium]
MKFITLLSFCMILFSACPKVSNQSTNNLGETIMVPLNQSIQIENEKINLLFTNVQDGRCPSGTNCIQAGKAKISMDFAVGDAVSAITFEAKGLCEDETGKCGSITTAQGYTIKLFSLNPYPSEENNGKRDYKAKVMITKK